MLCLVHGYGLTGSGSNQWTRSIARGLCELGETVHLVCQENRPEQFDFIAEAHAYDPSGEPTLLFRRNVPFRGRCIMHRPLLEILPTYVRPAPDVTSMASILDLPREKLDDYVARNEATLRRILADHDISAVHVNHVVLMAVAVHRACRAAGVPFGVMPHGSAIEYVVKHDERMRELARAALADAHTIFLLSDEMRERIQSVFPEITDAEAKMVMASAGVDTRQFQVIPRSARMESIGRLKDAMADSPRGCRLDQQRALHEGLREDLELDELLALLAGFSDFPPKLPDEAVEKRLDGIDWTSDDIILYVGKLIGYKGLPALIVAFPAILERRPNARLIVAGRGNLRGALQALVYALADGHRRLARNILEWGGAVEGEERLPFERPIHFLHNLERRDLLDAYFERAACADLIDKVIFTGYLEHHLLCHLFPCCDVAIFPSVVKEAAPLVVPEAMASGCFPIGTDYAGMGTSLDVAAEAVPDDIGRLMRLRHDPRYTTCDIVENVPRALEHTDDYREALRDLAVRRYDWRSVAGSLATHMKAMAGYASTANWSDASRL